MPGGFPGGGFPGAGAGAGAGAQDAGVEDLDWWLYKPIIDQTYKYYR